MNSSLRFVAALSLAGFGLAGCAENSLFVEPGDAPFGEANRQTMMAQVIDPDPQYDEPMVGSGQRAASAVEAYRNDAVEEPTKQSTTSGVGGGSGGGGSN